MESTRERLLLAAERVIRRDGAHAMTLMSVAREAGVSRGGLLYHFSSKRALIEAMTTTRVAAGTAEMDSHITDYPGDGLTGAYVHLIRTAGPSRLDTALLAAAVEQPDLMASQREAMAELHRRSTAESTDPLLATVVRLACDGLLLNDVLGLDVLTPEERVNVTDRLLTLARTAIRASPEDATQQGEP